MRIGTATPLETLGDFGLFRDSIALDFICQRLQMGRYAGHNRFLILEIKAKGLSVGDPKEIEQAVEIVQRIVMDLNPALVITVWKNPHLRAELAL